jgi:hypothetical protein
MEIKLHHNAIEIFKDIELYSTRFINCCLLGTNQGTRYGEYDYYPVDIYKYKEVCGLSIGEAYDSAYAMATKLNEIKIELKLIDGRTLVTNLIHGIIYDKEVRTLVINWNKDFIPLISGNMPKGAFLMADVSMIEVQSTYRYSMYLLVQKNLWKLPIDGMFILRKEEIREQLGLKEHMYKQFKELHRSIIKPTLKDMYNKIGVNLKTKVMGDKVEFTHV